MAKVGHFYMAIDIGQQLRQEDKDRRPS